MILARRIFNIMEAPSQIGEIINDTRHLDVHPGTMNYKHRVEESQKIHTDNLIMANRLVNIKPVYGYTDLHANRGMLADKQSSKTGTVSISGTPKPQIKSKYGSSSAVPTLDGSLSARGPSRCPKLVSPRSGSQSAREASDSDKDLLKAIIMRSFLVQDGSRIEVIVVKEALRDQYGILGKCASDSQLYEIVLSSEEVSTLVDGDLLVTSIEKPEVWEVVLTKVVLVRVDTFSSIFAHAKPDVTLDLTVEKMSAAAQVPSKPKSTRPTSRTGGRGTKSGTKAPKAKKISPNQLTEAEAEKKKVAEEIGDSAEVHGAAAKLQAAQRAKKAKAETEKRRSAKAAAAVDAEQKKVTEPHAPSLPKKDGSARPARRV